MKEKRDLQANSLGWGRDIDISSIDAKNVGGKERQTEEERENKKSERERDINKGRKDTERRTRGFKVLKN
jgi:hypothetical protein